MDKKIDAQVLVRLQWAYLEELAAEGYETLRARNGEDSYTRVCDEQGNECLVRVMIINDLEQPNSVWVHSEARTDQESMPWHSGFTMLESGDIAESH
jgi:hypothetical protein|tara:strand:+ start:345 stop:635 length:291 start_codon:yes stop_codon:yes gene_type:complete